MQTATKLKKQGTEGKDKRGVLFRGVLFILVFLLFNISVSAFIEYRGGADRAGYADIVLNPEELINVYISNISGAGINRSQPVTDGVYAYVGTNEGKILKIDLETGTINNSVQTGGPVVASGLLKDGVLYIGSSDGNMYKIQTDTMTVMEKIKTSASISTSAVLLKRLNYPDQVLFVDDNG